MEIMYNEKTGKFEPAKKPYKTIEIKYETEEDYNNFEKILELSKSRKPILTDEQVICYVTTYKCPNCGGQFTDNGLLNYCYRCGQRFDWSDKMGGKE